MELSADLPHLVKRLECATAKLENLLAAKAVSSNASATPNRLVPSLNIASAFEAEVIKTEHVATTIAKANELEAPLSGIVGPLEAIIAKQREILEQASAQPKPANPQAALSSMMQPIQDEIGKITLLRESNRGSPLFNHLSAVAEGICAFGWMLIVLSLGHICAPLFCISVF